MTISLNGDILIFLLVVVIGWMLVDMYNGVIKNTMPVIYLNPHSARDTAIVALFFTCLFLVGIIIFQTVQANLNFDITPVVPPALPPSSSKETDSGSLVAPPPSALPPEDRVPFPPYRGSAL